MAQPLEDRIARILEACTQHIEEVIASSRIQAENAPCRLRRNRSNGQNPKLKAASPMGQKHSRQHLSLPQETQPQAIPQKRQQQGTSGTSESSASSSFGTTKSVESDTWAKIEPVIQGQHFGGLTTGDLSMQSLGQYSGLAINTSQVMTGNADIEDPLSAIHTGPAGSPAHHISPVMAQTGAVVQPPQAHLRNNPDNLFQAAPNDGQARSPNPNLMGSQLHHNRADSGIGGLDTTGAYFSGIQTYQNNLSNTSMSMFPPTPNVYQGMQGMSTVMGGFPTQAPQHAPMQMRYRQPHVPVSMPGGGGGTIDPRMIHFPNVVGSMGTGNNLNYNNGNGYSGFSPGGSDGVN